jgi:hypothetical protein
MYFPSNFTKIVFYRAVNLTTFNKKHFDQLLLQSYSLQCKGVSIAICYRLEGPRIESWWGWNFLHLSRPALGPPSLLYNGYRVSFVGVQRPGCGTDHTPPSTAKVKERIEIYLYSPSGSSWPVQGRTLPLLYLCLLYFKTIQIHPEIRHNALSLLWGQHHCYYSTSTIIKFLV